LETECYLKWSIGTKLHANTIRTVIFLPNAKELGNKWWANYVIGTLVHQVVWDIW